MNVSIPYPPPPGELQQQQQKRTGQPRPHPGVRNQSLFYIFMTKGKNHIQKDKSFHSRKKHIRVRDGMIEGLEESL